jgi:hypothetical protein
MTRRARRQRRPALLRTGPLWLRIATWLIAAAAALVVAGWVVLFSTGLGVLVHPPPWARAAAGAAALAAAVAGYAVGARAAWHADHAPGAGITAAVLVALVTWIALSWAAPGLSAFVRAEPVMTTRTVHSVWNPRRGPPFCGNRVQVAPLIAGAGGLCLRSLEARRLEGATLDLIGRGNGWATRVTAITAVRD